MATTRKALYANLDSEGAKPEIVAEGIRWLEQQGQDALVVVANLEKLSLLTSSLGAERVGRLQASESVTLGKVRLSAATDRKMVSSWLGPALVLYPSKELLDKVDSIVGVTSVLVVPWMKSDVQSWIATWRAEQFGSIKSSSVASPPPPKHGLLVAALNSLTHRVNKSTGLSHPGDKAAAIDLFAILREAEVPFDAEEVKSLLLARFGWGAQQANQVRDLVADLQAGKRPRKHPGYQKPCWNANILQIWREEAQATQSGSATP